jgi:hypothetical protein
MIMVKKIVALLLLAVVIGYVGLSWSQLKSSNVEDLVLCSVDKGGIYIPSKVCYWYLTNHRNDAEDVNQLSQNGGLSFILGVYQGSNDGMDDKKVADYNQRTLEIADHFIRIGLDINAINQTDGLTPLHAEVLANNPKLVEFLIKKGADLSVKEKNNNLTPLQFAESLVGRNEGIDRSEVLSLLKR